MTALFINPKAGNGEGLLTGKKVEAYLASRSIPFTKFDYFWPDNISKDITEVWVVGGDGTLNFFINTYPEINIPVSIITGGTGNDFAFALYGNRSFDEQLAIATGENVISIDALTCNGKICMNGVGIGFDGEVSRALWGKKKRLGVVSYWIEVLKKLLFYPSPFLKIDIGYTIYVGNYFMISAANGMRYGGDFMVTPNAELANGFIELMMVKKLNFFRRLKALLLIEKGKHISLDFIETIRVKKVIINGDVDLPAHLDGEVVISKQFEIEVIPGKYRFKA